MSRCSDKAPLRRFCQDYGATFGEAFTFRRGIYRIFTQGQVLMQLLGRLGEIRCLWVFRFAYLMISRRRGVQIDFSENISGGLVLAHAYGITVNSGSVLGGRCILFKGCTIGGVRVGKRKGVPRLGDRVVVGLNSTIVGGVTIGDDVMIAPNTFVNFDVPSHSIVIGSPGVIHNKNNATSAYFPV